MHINTIIKHRINTIADLHNTPIEYGVELDLRTNGNSIILHHDVFADGVIFEDYLNHYKHGIIILNTKTDGLEPYLLELMKKENVKDFFFLDTALPTLVKTIKNGCSKLAVRFSEYEPLDFVMQFAGKADWVWVDCFTTNILTPEVYRQLKAHFKICIVSPELQSHPLEWIEDFKKAFAGFELDAVCTKHPDLWK